jgi:hypothetical protein
MNILLVMGWPDVVASSIPAISVAAVLIIVLYFARGDKK